jgi:salicylate hydroxylase
MLSNLLGHSSTTKSTISLALLAFDNVRRPVAAGVVERSSKNGELLGLGMDGIDFDKEPERLGELGDAIIKNWEWCWETTVDEDNEKAVTMLEESCRQA